VGKGSTKFPLSPISINEKAPAKKDRGGGFLRACRGLLFGRKKCKDKPIRNGFEVLRTFNLAVFNETLVK